MKKIEDILNYLSGYTSNFRDDFFIIGSTALLLSGYDIGHVNDIDILTSTKDADYLKIELKEFLLDFQPEKETLFRSNFGRFLINNIEIEVMGDLEIRKNDVWQKLQIIDYKIVELENISLKTPKPIELQRILKLFERNKDLEKLKRYF